MRARGREQGSILLLTLGFVVLALLLVLTVVDASVVFLTRRDLAAAADSLALAAAQQADLPALYAQGPGATLALDPAGVQAAVQRLAADYPPSWHFTAALTSGGAARVVAEDAVSLPVVGVVRVSARSQAVSATG